MYCVRFLVGQLTCTRMVNYFFYNLLFIYSPDPLLSFHFPWVVNLLHRHFRFEGVCWDAHFNSWHYIFGSMVHLLTYFTFWLSQNTDRTELSSPWVSVFSLLPVRKTSFSPIGVTESENNTGLICFPSPSQSPLIWLNLWADSFLFMFAKVILVKREILFDNCFNKGSW